MRMAKQINGIMSSIIKLTTKQFWRISRYILVKNTTKGLRIMIDMRTYVIFMRFSSVGKYKVIKI